MQTLVMGWDHDEDDIGERAGQVRPASAKRPLRRFVSTPAPYASAAHHVAASIQGLDELLHGAEKISAIRKKRGNQRLGDAGNGETAAARSISDACEDAAELPTSRQAKSRMYERR